MTTDTKLVTAEALLCMPDDGVPRELIDGRILELMPPTFGHNLIMARWMLLLGTFVKERKLGEVLPGDVGVIVRRDPDTVRGPDVCFISNERLPSHAAHDRFLDVAPDLIVEIVSSNDRAPGGAPLETSFPK